MAELEKDDFLILPDNRGEIYLAAELTAGAILDRPQRLPIFSEQMGNIYLSAQMEGRDRVTLLDKYLDHMGNFSRSGWEKRQDQELTEESARAILLANPGRNGKRNIRDRIVDSVLRGFVNDRFEGPNKADWRGSIETQMTFLRAVALPDADPQLLRIWLNSLYGRGSVLPRFGLAKRALSMSRMVASPEDEKYIDMTMELGRGIHSAIYVVGEGDEAERLNANSNHLVFALGSCVAIYQQGLDPTRGDGRILHRTNIGLQNRAETKLINKRTLGYEVNLDPEALKSIPFTPDILEIAKTAVTYPDRYQQLMNASTQLEQHQRNKQQEGRRFFMGYPESFLQSALVKDEEGKVKFPYYLFDRYPRTVASIVNLIERDAVNDDFSKYLEEAMGQLGPDWQRAPFAQSELMGYFMANSEIPEAPVERIKRIDELLRQDDMVEWLKERQVRETKIPHAKLDREKGIGLAIIYNDEFELTELQSYLEVKMSQEYLERAIKIFSANQNLRAGMQGRFTRMPTKGGDRYKLDDHPQLPEVVSRAVINKVGSGGLSYALTFCPEKLIRPDGSSIKISGHVNFENGIANIVPAERLGVAAKMEWILESIILSLVERSCCPSIDEVVEERKKIESGVTKDTAIPGYIGHVGGYRLDGTRKQYTKEANDNFIEAIGQLKGETQGISLAEVNRTHQEDLAKQAQKDDRFLTYYKGKDAEGEEYAIDRTSPDQLIQLV